MLNEISLVHPTSIGLFGQIQLLDQGLVLLDKALDADVGLAQVPVRRVQGCLEALLFLAQVCLVAELGLQLLYYADRLFQFVLGINEGFFQFFISLQGVF